MTPREFRQEQNLEFDHFQELTSTGIKPNYVNIEMFAHEYHKAKLKLLGIADVVSSTCDEIFEQASKIDQTLLITVCVRLVAQQQIMIKCTKAICAINFTLCYSQLIYQI